MGVALISLSGLTFSCRSEDHSPVSYTITQTPDSSVLSASSPYERCGKSYEMAEMVNQHREANGIKPLGVNPLLNESAQVKADDMATNNYFSHNSPDGKGLIDYMKGAGIDPDNSFAWAGENLAKNNYPNPIEIAMIGLEASKGHDENLSREKFTMIGIGVAYDPLYDRCYYVQHFLGPG